MNKQNNPTGRDGESKPMWSSIAPSRCNGKTNKRIKTTHGPLDVADLDV